MKNIPLLIGSLLFTLFAVIGVAVLFTNKANAPIVPVEEKLLLSDSPHIKGKSEATVTIVEFSDLQCPACKAVQPLVQSVLSAYPNDVRLVYRHFPLRSIHPHAALAARAAEAAHKQNAFFEYHDKLFVTQEAWAEEKNPTAKFVEYAKELKLNAEQFAKDIEDETLDMRVVLDERDGNTIGISSTPTFFVNGILTDINSLSSVVDQLVASKE